MWPKALLRTVSLATAAIAEKILVLRIEAGYPCLTVDDVERLPCRRQLFELQDETGIVTEGLAAFLIVAKLLQSRNQARRLQRDFSCNFKDGLAFLQSLAQLDRLQVEGVKHVLVSHRLS